MLRHNNTSKRLPFFLSRTTERSKDCSDKYLNDDNQYESVLMDTNLPSHCAVQPAGRLGGGWSGPASGLVCPSCCLTPGSAMTTQSYLSAQSVRNDIEIIDHIVEYSLLQVI